MSRSTTFMCVHACACTQSKSKACHLKQRHSETERALQSPAMGGEGARNLSTSYTSASARARTTNREPAGCGSRAHEGALLLTQVRVLPGASTWGQRGVSVGCFPG